MSVARAQELVARARNAGITVHEAPGCYSRGNGQTSNYGGWENHHTATAYANANLGVLINGRPDLSGPLSNSCGWANGDLGIIAAHPANHAGASGGWDTSPLPTTSLFNKLMWGHEIIYPGNQAMTAAQYRTMMIVSKIGVDIWGYGDLNRIKNHQGTSITGKWDPGYAPGKTVPASQIRNDIRAFFATPPPSIPSDVEEDDFMIVPATGPRDSNGELTGDDYVSIPMNGKTLLFIATGFNRKIEVLQIAAVRDNNGQGTPSYTSSPVVPQQLQHINPDQPGPIQIGGGCRVVQLRYRADHDFTVWAA